MTVSVDRGALVAAAHHAQQCAEHAAADLAAVLPAARAIDVEAQWQSRAAAQFRRGADELEHSVRRAHAEAVGAGEHCAALARWLAARVDGIW